MKIYIQSSRTTAFSLEVENHYTIENVKKMIQESENIPADGYYLHFNCVKLEDKKMLSDYGIETKSFIQMIPSDAEHMKLTVMNNNGKTFSIEVNENFTINTLKSKIQNVCEIPLDRQCFTCFDERTLSSNFEKEHGEIYNDLKEHREELANIVASLEKGKTTSAVDQSEVQDNDFDGNDICNDEEEIQILKSVKSTEKSKRRAPSTRKNYDQKIESHENKSLIEVHRNNQFHSSELVVFNSTERTSCHRFHKDALNLDKNKNYFCDECHFVVKLREYKTGLRVIKFEGNHECE